MGNARQLAAQLTAWVEATQPRIAQKRYLARLQASPADQARLLAEAMALELLAEEVQVGARHYSTFRLLRGAMRHILDAMQRELARAPDSSQGQDDLDEIAAWAEGRALGYRIAWEELSQTLKGLGE